MDSDKYCVTCLPESVAMNISTDTDAYNDFHLDSLKDTENEKCMYEISEKEERDILEKEDVSPNSANTLEKDAQKIVNKKGQTLESRKRSYDLSSEEMVVDKIPKKKCPPPSDLDILENSIHYPGSSAVTIQELLSNVKKLKVKGLSSEYTSIKIEPPAGTFNSSKLKANHSKNRYSDVLCFDHSCVILPPVGDDNSSCYINANFVDGYKQKNAFICTQGPLPNTFVDFWRMVWHKQTQVIVMTTRTVERSRIKCGQYWPLEKKSSKKYEEFVVYNNGATENKEFTETQLKLNNTHTGESRVITHLQFTSWPDHGVPPAAPFLDFLFRVRHVQEMSTREMGSSWTGHSLGPPVVVHCSAGIGRTGTFITVDICLRQLDDIGTIDVKETVRRIRSQRAFSIQTPDQYVFCYLAVIAHAQRCGFLSSEKLLTLKDIE